MYPPYNNQYNYNPYMQYGYGNYDYLRIQRQNQRKDIKHYSIIAGICVTAYVLLQGFLSFPFMAFPTLRALYSSNGTFTCAVGIILSIISVLVPFAIGVVVIKRRDGVETVKLNAPDRVSTMLLLVPAAFALCLVANYVTALTTTWLGNFGIELSGGEFNAPDSLIGRIVYIIEIAVVPPLCEEVATRGVVMQPLRKYGDRFAILASSMVFAIMHGNLVQAPFAFIAGMVIGYCVCVTNSLWTGILIHFANNAFSVIVEFIIKDMESSFKQDLIYYSAVGVCIAIGIACAVYLCLRRGKVLYVTGRVGSLSSIEKAKAYIFTVPMVIALLIMVAITAQFVNWTGNF